MEFFTFSNSKRPKRLSEGTRTFAYESLDHKYGKDTEKVNAAILDDIADFEDKTPVEQYNLCIEEIAKQARIRICPGERISGAATFGEAIYHAVPARRKGEIVFPSVSHLTLDFEAVLSVGINGIEETVKQRRLDDALTERQKEFLESALRCIAAMRHWHSRYLDVLSDMPGYADNYKNLLRVPFFPATNFYEAVQSLWFTFAFVRLCGNWPGIGRLDVLLGKYLEADLKEGTITLDEAREILAHFFIKGCEWVLGGNFYGGDSQHYQNILLAGIDEKGNEVTNEVTYLVLDILEEFNIGDFPTSIRLNKNSPEKLLRRAAEVVKHGGGTVAFYNEEVVIAAMEQVGYPQSEARRFANDGCWEMQVPGKTNFHYIPIDALGILLNETLKIGETPVVFDSFEALKQAYFWDLDKAISKVYQERFTETGEIITPPPGPSTVVSIFEGGCIENAQDYTEGGPVYYVRSPQLGGAADAGNSVRVIDKLCFIDKIISFSDFMQVLHNDWEGQEVLRQYVLNKVSCYGNDDDEADAYTKEVVDTFADLVLSYKTEPKAFFVPGVSTFGRQILWAETRTASPHGHKRGDVLAPNMGATPGSDLNGATALIASYCKLDLKKQVTGAALDLKLLPSATI